MTNRIYITHCSRKKDDSLKNSNARVTPDKLYTARFVKYFIRRCKLRNVKWAIFSDQFGVVFPTDKIPWYDKSPDSVTEEDREALFRDTLNKIKGYQVWFYRLFHFHHFYRDLLDDLKKAGIDINIFWHLDEIV